MKLGEALIKRDEYIKKLENLKERAKNNVRVQEMMNRMRMLII